jgi:hypothetical protein
MYCGNSPESWVRASIALDRQSGSLSMTVQLETDSTAAGPKGKATVTIKDRTGNTLAIVESPELETGGKPPGSVAIRNFNASGRIRPELARQAKFVHVEAHCTGSLLRIYDVSLDDLRRAFDFAVTFVAAAGL